MCTASLAENALSQLILLGSKKVGKWGRLTFASKVEVVFLLPIFFWLSSICLMRSSSSCLQSLGHLPVALKFEVVFQKLFWAILVDLQMFENMLYLSLAISLLVRPGGQQTWEKVRTCEPNSQTVLTTNVDILDHNIDFQGSGPKSPQNKKKIKKKQTRSQVKFRFVQVILMNIQGLF